jgi:hypothetical protein
MNDIPWISCNVLWSRVGRCGGSAALGGVQPYRFKVVAQRELPGCHRTPLGRLGHWRKGHGIRAVGGSAAAINGSARRWIMNRRLGANFMHGARVDAAMGWGNCAYNEVSRVQSLLAYALRIDSGIWF